MFKVIQGTLGVQFPVWSTPTTAFEKEAIAASALLIMSFGAKQSGGAPGSSFQGQEFHCAAERSGEFALRHG